jgi:hypothetical protein
MRPPITRMSLIGNCGDYGTTDDDAAKSLIKPNVADGILRRDDSLFNLIVFLCVSAPLREISSARLTVSRRGSRAWDCGPLGLRLGD